MWRESTVQLVIMRSALRFFGLLLVLAGTWLGACDSLAADAATPKRVLLIHSFGRDFAPYDTIASVFRTELAKRSSQPIVLFEATLDAGRPVTNEEERAFLEYLRARFAGQAPDLVVTIGPPAARFYLAHRDQLFPSIPLVMAALDERLARGAALRANDAAVVGKVDLPQPVREHLSAPARYDHDRRRHRRIEARAVLAERSCRERRRRSRTSKLPVAQRSLVRSDERAGRQLAAQLGSALRPADSRCGGRPA